VLFWFFPCLAAWFSSHAAPAPHPHWSVGFHRMSFLDPLDLQPMNAIAFYPSTDVEHTTRVGGYHWLPRKIRRSLSAVSRC